MTGPARPLKIRYVSWSEIHRALSVLANSVRSTFNPEVVVAIAKGGLIPSRIIADLLMIEEMGFIEVKFYKAIGLRGEKPFIKYLALPALRDRNVLVVDDVIDSGRTIQLVIDALSSYAPRSMKTLVLYLKPWAAFTPDYYYEVTNEWIVFPWEICESKKEGVSIEHEEFVEFGKYCGF